MEDTELRRIAAWMRASPEDGMEDTELCRAGLMKGPESGSMDNAFVEWQHGRGRCWMTAWTPLSFDGQDE